MKVNRSSVSIFLVDRVDIFGNTNTTLKEVPFLLASTEY